MTSSFIPLGQRARIKHDVTFRRNSPGGGTSWSSESYSVWWSLLECGTGGKVCYLPLPCYLLVLADGEYNWTISSGRYTADLRDGGDFGASAPGTATTIVLVVRLLRSVRCLLCRYVCVIARHSFQTQRPLTSIFGTML